MRVLVTRPLADAERTAAKLKTRGHEAVIEPLLKIEPVPFQLDSETFEAVAITSASALHVAGKKLAAFFSLPLFAVGPHSGEVASQAGFHDVKICGGNVQTLAKAMRETLKSGARVLYLAGENRAQNLAALLQPAGIEVETRVVYRAVPSEQISEKTLALLQAGEIGAVLHYSARSAAIFLALIQKAKLTHAARNPRHLCLSDAVASSLIRAGFRTETAARPDEDALFALLGG